MVEQTEGDRQREWADFVRREVHYCVSSLVHDLAKVYGEDIPGLNDLTEAAFELSTPIDDYETAGEYEGIQVREHDDLGWQYSTTASRKAHDEFAVDEGEDERDRPDAWIDINADSEEDAWREACEAENIDPDQREIYEHWIVSDWFARKLAEKGERTGELSNLTIWGRTTTGQAISMDRVIQEIYAETRGA